LQRVASSSFPPVADPKSAEIDVLEKVLARKRGGQESDDVHRRAASVARQFAAGGVVSLRCG
jgi:hypothetical protein